jgi:uncharacterized membrane protein YedE/YeeE
MKRRRQQNAVALVSGVLFGVGLALGGMTRPRKVLGFLDVFGAWDPSLAFVMLGAISVHFAVYRVIRGTAAPLFADEFALPTRRNVDAKLVLGSAVFGVGWGLAGYCPGPAIASLASGSPAVVLFVATLLLGLFITGKLEGLHESRLRSSARAGSPAPSSPSNTSAEAGQPSS